jgi:signal peptidase II
VRVDGHGFGRALIVAALALAVDQATKALVRSEIDPGGRVDFIAGIDFVHVSNEGIAFGLLADAGTWVLGLAAVAFALLLGYFLAHGGRRGLWLPIGLLAGGALGNLLDRAREGAVTDFIDPPRWPAFNLADVEITIGVVLLFLIFLAGVEDEDGERTETAGGAAR